MAGEASVLNNLAVFTVVFSGPYTPIMVYHFDEAQPHTNVFNPFTFTLQMITVYVIM